MQGAETIRKCTALSACILFVISPAVGQIASIEPVRPSAPILWRPYLAPEVPPARLANSIRIRDLVRAGELYLTVQDAIALALENNIDIEIARYNPILSAWRIQRAQAGGALPGVPSNASQANSVASGQGVAGSQAAAGVTPTGSTTTGNNTANAAVAQIGPVTQTLDPIIQEASTFTHKTQPQPDVVQTLTPVLIPNSRVYSASYQQGFLTGGSVTLTYTEHYLNENALSDVLNPSVAPTLSLSLQQPLLNGFGIAVNARTITVAKINAGISDLNFKSQVINTVVDVLNAYYGLAADFENVKAKQSALSTAQELYNNNKRQVDVGTLARLELTSADSLVASSQQALEDARSGRAEDELRLKNLLSRTGTKDPVLAEAEIIPVDRIVIPEQDNLPPVQDLVKQALANRADIASAYANTKAAEINALGTKNGILPQLIPFTGASNAGLTGRPQTVKVCPPPPAPLAECVVENPDPYFVGGGIGSALGQIFRRNFPTQRIGFYYAEPIHNGQAQADFAIDQLQLRQTQLTTQKDVNQVGVDVMNAVVALQQARARYNAAVRNRILDQQLLDAEQRKFSLGASTPYNVVQQQRDLSAAQFTELSALASYASARIALDQTLGTTLEVNHVSLAEAKTGVVAQPAAK